MSLWLVKATQGPTLRCSSFVWMLCYYHLKILNNFWTRSLAFLFCTRFQKLHSCSWSIVSQSDVRPSLGELCPGPDLYPATWAFPVVQRLPDQKTTARGMQEPKVTAIELKRLKELTIISTTCEAEVRKGNKFCGVLCCLFGGIGGGYCFACFLFCSALGFVGLFFLLCLLWFCFLH